MARPPTATYPVTLLLEGRSCLVVGGGRVATRKVTGLLEAGALVTVVAPEVTTELEALAERGERVALHRRPYRSGDAEGHRLVFTATGVAEVDQRVADDAERHRVWVNSADDPPHCSFLLPSVHRDGPVTVAVSTGGASPALAAWLRRRLARDLGPWVGEVAGLLAGARARLRSEGRSPSEVDWDGLFEGPLIELVAGGDRQGARRLLEASLVRDADPARPDRPRGPSD